MNVTIELLGEEHKGKYGSDCMVVRFEHNGHKIEIYENDYNEPDEEGQNDYRVHIDGEVISGYGRLADAIASVISDDNAWTNDNHEFANTPRK